VLEELQAGWNEEGQGRLSCPELRSQEAAKEREMSSITKDAYEGDIVSRLRNWRGLHLAHSGGLFEEAADEIERLRGWGMSEGKQEDDRPPPLKVDRIVLIVHHRNRNGLKFWASRLAESFSCCERVSLPKGEDERERITDKEREAIREAAGAYMDNDDDEQCAKIAATLHGLLKRLG
jgi:hypothetical protein